MVCAQFCFEFHIQPQVRSSAGIRVRFSQSPATIASLRCRPSLVATILDLIRDVAFLLTEHVRL